MSDTMETLLLVSRLRPGLGIDPDTIEVTMQVHPTFLVDVEMSKELLQSGMRIARDKSAAERGIPAWRATWDEEWFLGEPDPTRAFIENRPLQRLDWS